MSEFRKAYTDKLVIRAKVEITLGNNLMAWRLLEDAHVFSQPYVASHLFVHWEMLKLAVFEREFQEVVGQIFRFVLAAPGSLFKTYPIGNTGRSDVNMFMPMPLSNRVQRKLREFEKFERLRVKQGGILQKPQRQHPLTRK